MVELKQSATANDAKVLLNSALGGKTVEDLLNKAGLLRGAVEGPLNKTLEEIAKVINSDQNKTPDSIIAALKANKTITDNLAGLNANKGAVGLDKEVTVESIKPALEQYLQANKKPEQSLSQSAAPQPSSKTPTPTKSTVAVPPTSTPTSTTAPTTPAVTPNPTTASSTTPSPTPTTAETEEQIKARKEKELAQNNSGSWTDMLKNIPIIGPLIEMLVKAFEGNNNTNQTPQNTTPATPSTTGNQTNSPTAGAGDITLGQKPTTPTPTPTPTPSTAAPVPAPTPTNPNIASAGGTRGK
jgi:hypothetical protein